MFFCIGLETGSLRINVPCLVLLVLVLIILIFLNMMQHACQKIFGNLSLLACFEVQYSTTSEMVLNFYISIASLQNWTDFYNTIKEERFLAWASSFCCQCCKTFFFVSIGGSKYACPFVHSKLFSLI